MEPVRAGRRRILCALGGHGFARCARGSGGSSWFRAGRPRIRALRACGDGGWFRAGRRRIPRAARATTAAGAGSALDGNGFGARCARTALAARAGSALGGDGFARCARARRRLVARRTATDSVRAASTATGSSLFRLGGNGFGARCATGDGGWSLSALGGNGFAGAARERLWRLELVPRWAATDSRAATAAGANRTGRRRIPRALCATLWRLELVPRWAATDSLGAARERLWRLELVPRWRAARVRDGGSFRAGRQRIRCALRAARVCSGWAATESCAGEERAVRGGLRGRAIANAGWHLVVFSPHPAISAVRRSRRALATLAA
jgi:hypothetical protein